MPTATTLGGWAVVILFGAGFYWVNGQKKNKNKRPLAKQAGKAVEPVKEHKSRKARKDGSGDQETKLNQKDKKKTKQPTKANQAFTSYPVAKDTDGDDEADNQEFARQLSNAKTGTLTAPKSQTGTRPKSVKQTHAKEKALAETSSDNATAPSSTTGGDADDDQSPINSPDLSATSVASPITNGVSDMLEKPAVGPSVLRVTAPTNPSQSKREKPPTTFEAVETKKQRQNRKKAEAKKLQREEEEKERKALMEKQRRTAREAEGRAAKDGSAFMAAKAPSTSAWAGSAPAGADGKTTTPANKVELLDTYEPSSSAATPAVTNPTPALSEEEIYSPSEIFGSQQVDPSTLSYEEQVKYATEASAEWEVVKAKERKKKAAQKENKNSKDESQSSTDDLPDYSPPPKISPTGPGQKWDNSLVYVENGEVVEEKLETQDSEWEVS